MCVITHRSIAHYLHGFIVEDVLPRCTSSFISYLGGRMMWVILSGLTLMNGCTTFVARRGSGNASVVASWSLDVIGSVWVVRLFKQAGHLDIASNGVQKPSGFQFYLLELHGLGHE